MPNILTPVSLWNNFDCSLELNPEKEFEGIYSGVRVELINFYGRDTGEGRIKIAAAYASDANASSPTSGTVLVLPDSKETIDIEVIKLFAKRGFNVLMVDYRGESEGCNHFTRYPENIYYANTAKCGRRKDYVDDSADRTCWFEWVGVGLYAAKYIRERTGNDNIAVVGIRDGGETAWKLGVADKFKCIVPVCAAGWRAYNGISKYSAADIELDNERYRFIAGVDSQAYAPYVCCPVLMLCSTNDFDFDYDRAYDTFSRINPQYLGESVIAYSLRYSASIGANSVNDMFLFLNKHLKNHQVFVPKPAEVTVEVDEDSNLIARVTVDTHGVVDKCDVFLAEDCQNSALRDWGICAPKDELKREYFLNIYEKSATIFVLCRVRYFNGFTVWSKVAVKKISGKFRNMQKKCNVLCSGNKAVDAFSIADPFSCAVGGIFLAEEDALPAIVTKAKGVKGVYSPFGLTTFRLCNPQFAASGTSVLSADVFCDEQAELIFTMRDLTGGEDYVCAVNVVGGVWQNAILESKMFKTANGVQLADFLGDMKMSITCRTDFAINNVMWL